MEILTIILFYLRILAKSTTPLKEKIEQKYTDSERKLTKSQSIHDAWIYV